MSRVVALIEQEQLFRSPGLKLADVAQRLEVSARILSTCLNTNRGCSFSKFLNTYRVDYAKQLMLTQPDIKISAVCEQAGFANEVTFFRTFKDIVGKPPKEWMSDHAEKTVT
jgi:YesN/AraC family two-component response regulator